MTPPEFGCGVQRKGSNAECDLDIGLNNLAYMATKKPLSAEKRVVALLLKVLIY